MLLRFAFRTNAHVPHGELFSVRAAPNCCDMTIHAKGLAQRPGPQEALSTHCALSVSTPCGPHAEGAAGVPCHFSFPPPQGSAGAPGLPQALPLAGARCSLPLARRPCGTSLRSQSTHASTVTVHEIRTTLPYPTCLFIFPT